MIKCLSHIQLKLIPKNVKNHSNCAIGITSGIEHQIDLILGSSFPNRPAYRTNPSETREIRQEVEELIAKGWVQDSMSPCAMPIILFPKKDGTWGMCSDCRAINNITIKYRHHIPRLDDLLDELHGSQIFPKLILKVGIIKSV